MIVQTPESKETTMSLKSPKGDAAAEVEEVEDAVDDAVDDALEPTPKISIIMKIQKYK